MPNWCHNHWIVSGDPGRVRECFELLTEAKEDGSRRVTFSKVLPVPKILQRLYRLNPKFHGEKGGLWILHPEKSYDGKDMLNGARRLTEEEQAELKALGCENESDWARAHWGCKWDASEEGYGAANSAEIEEGAASFAFETPWCPPEGVFQALCERFPDLRLSGTYADESMEYSGQLRREDFEGKPADPTAAAAAG